MSKFSDRKEESCWGGTVVSRSSESYVGQLAQPSNNSRVEMRCKVYRIAKEESKERLLRSEGRKQRRSCAGLLLLQLGQSSLEAALIVHGTAAAATSASAHHAATATSAAATAAATAASAVASCTRRAAAAGLVVSALVVFVLSRWRCRRRSACHEHALIRRFFLLLLLIGDRLAELVEAVGQRREAASKLQTVLQEGTNTAEERTQ